MNDSHTAIDLHMLPANVEVAQYETEQKNPRFRGNRLIEALPSTVDEIELIEMLKYLPEFEPSMRDWEPHDRLQELLSLTNIMVPLASHVQLARAIDSLMREGYVGRRPMSKEHISIFHRINEGATKRKPFRQTAESIKPQLSTALVGVSGMGKTTTVTRWLAHLPKVVYHPELDLYQIPYIHFEMPSDGKSEKALATGIIKGIDDLLPQFDYYEDIVAKSRASGMVMLRQAARLMNKHCVGLLVADEIQNISNTRKEDQIVMTELTSLCNESQVPILFIGTNKAERVLGLDFRQARRSLGLGLGDWGPLPRWDVSYCPEGGTQLTDGEWVDFMRTLWRYQWVKTPVQLDESMLNALFDCTQGIIDLAIKLFAVAQGRAILDGSEQISEQLIRDVYRLEMKLVHPMVDALRTGDMAALIKFEDIKPAATKKVLEDIATRYRGQRTPLASARPGTEAFEAHMTGVARSLGLSDEDAVAVARDASEDGLAGTVFEATEHLVKKLKPSRATRKKSQTGGIEALEVRDYSARPLDYRRAPAEAAQAGTSVLQKLTELGMASDVEDVLCLA